MGIVRFKLNGIRAFRNWGQNGDSQHFCVDCAREATKGQTLIPFLNGQLETVLSEFGKDMGAMISCDACGEVVETFYPRDFWAEDESDEGREHNQLLFKKF